MANNSSHKKQANSAAGVGFADQHQSTINIDPKADAPQKSPESSALQNQAAAETESLNKIRDILFGQQVQTHEQRFEQLEQRVENECDRLRTDFQKQISTLEDRLVEHVDRLTEQIRTEASDRKAANERLRNTLSDSEASLTHRLEELDEKVGETRQELLDEMKHQVLTLKSSVESQLEDLLADLDKETDSRKTSIQQERKKLATLFGELSQQVGGND